MRPGSWRSSRLSTIPTFPVFFGSGGKIISINQLFSPLLREATLFADSFDGHLRVGYQDVYLLIRLCAFAATGYSCPLELKLLVPELLRYYGVLFHASPHWMRCHE